MNHIIKNKIILSLDKSETINARGERYIPLSKLKRNLESRFVAERDFADFMRLLTNNRDYTTEVIQRLYHTPIDDLGADENFKITSGYYI